MTRGDIIINILKKNIIPRISNNKKHLFECWVRDLRILWKTLLLLIKNYRKRT